MHGRRPRHSPAVSPAEPHQYLRLSREGLRFVKFVEDDPLEVACLEHRKDKLVGRLALRGLLEFVAFDSGQPLAARDELGLQQRGPLRFIAAIPVRDPLAHAFFQLVQRVHCVRLRRAPAAPEICRLSRCVELCDVGDALGVHAAVQNFVCRDDHIILAQLPRRVVGQARNVFHEQHFPLVLRHELLDLRLPLVHQVAGHQN
mmetsp:Transcript_11868/g.28755  ORF Transcript_11868/g.28755 Transcript_11868/m.28755 type:complete len:202 (+) Transcript_11868:3648-4253(+)